VDLNVDDDDDEDEEGACASPAPCPHRRNQLVITLAFTPTRILLFIITSVS
jgi:hypothetical protein